MKTIINMRDFIVFMMLGMLLLLASTARGQQKILPLFRNDKDEVNVDPAYHQYWDYENAYERDIEDIYQLSVAACYQWVKPSTTHELFLNIDYISDNKGRLSKHYDPNLASQTNYTKHFGMLPNLMYQVYF